MSDLRYALRTLAKTPLFTSIVLLTLALGIGANTAIVTVINAVLLRPLPYPAPEQLVRVRAGSSWPDMRDWIAQARSFTAIGGFRAQLFDLSNGDVPERVDGALVTADLFTVLGAQPQLGRLIDARDQNAGAPHVAVVSAPFWRTQLAADRGAIGRTVLLNGTSYQVIGVLADGFDLPGQKAHVFAPFYPETPQEAEARGAHTLRAMLRLRPSVSLPAAQAEMDGVAARLADAYPRTNRDMRFRLLPLADSLVGSMRSVLLMVLATVGFVLLIACVNVANLLIARAATRRAEFAIRAALGAAPRRLTRLLLTESLVLAIGGATLGLAVSWWITRAVAGIAPETLLRVDQLTIDARVLAFTAAVAILTGLLFGIAPSWIASRRSLRDAAGSGARISKGSSRLRAGLMAVEVALALVLVASSGLLLRSIATLTAQPLGFSSDHLLTGNIQLSATRFRDIATRTRLYDDLVTSLASVPGVTSVGLVTELPIGGTPLMHNLSFEGRAFAPGTEPEIYYRGISTGYFATLDIPILRGRSFGQDDRATSEPVAIANEAFARTYYPGLDVVGRRVKWTSGNGEWITIVGVVPDIRGVSLDEGEVPALYLPYAQERNWWRMWTDVVVRTQGPPAALAAEMRRAVATADRTVPIAKIRTMDDVVTESVADRRFNLFLIGAFAALALILACAGTYGVMAFLVTERQREMGVRLALGARPRDVLALVLRHALVIGSAGAVAGLALSVAASRFLTAFLYGVAPTDPLTLGAAAVILLATTALAGYVPARRAGRVDPVIALRSE